MNIENLIKNFKNKITTKNHIYNSTLYFSKFKYKESPFLTI